MAKNRVQTIVIGVVVFIGLIIAFVMGLFTYMSITASPLHPNPANVRTVPAGPVAPKWSAAAERAKQAALAALIEQNLPGLSVAVGVGGELVWAEGLGWADITTQKPVQPNMRFRIGGASIPLTSAAAGLLIEQGRLKLDDEIQTYVPEYPKKQWPVTVRQLMAHLGGVRADNNDEEPLGERCVRTIDGLQRFSDASLRTEPGTEYRYSTYGWVLVSAAIDQAANEPFFSFMRTRVLEPLGMKDTEPDYSMSEPIPNLATFYYPKFAADNRYGPDPAREGDYSCLAGAMGFLTTPSDLVRFALGLQGGKLLKPETLAMLQEPQRVRAGTETGYTLGWDLDAATVNGQPTRTLGHDSEMMIGGTTSFRIFPEHGIIVAVVTNTSWADTASISAKIAEAFISSTDTRPRRQ